MRPPEVFEHGTILRSIQGGFRIQRPGRETYGRIFVRLVNGAHATWWRATCDGWDGYTWNRDRTIARPTIAELEAAIRDYVAGLDRHARACQLPN